MCISGAGAAGACGGIFLCAGSPRCGVLLRCAAVLGLSAGNGDTRAAACMGARRCFTDRGLLGLAPVRLGFPGLGRLRRRRAAFQCLSEGLRVDAGVPGLHVCVCVCVLVWGAVGACACLPHIGSGRKRPGEAPLHLRLLRGSRFKRL